MGFHLVLLPKDPVCNSKVRHAIIPEQSPVLLKGMGKNDVSYE